MTRGRHRRETPRPARMARVALALAAVLLAGVVGLTGHRLSQTSSAAPEASPTTASPSRTAASPSTASPSPTAASPSTVSPSTAGPDPCGFSPRGVPSCGALVGASYGGNDDPAAWEASMGTDLALRRTYFAAWEVDEALRTVRADHRAGRLPWISFKLPHSWADMASGAGDAWARDIARRLSEEDGPVWVAFHHEPEGDGPIAAWTAMQERLGPIVRGTAPRVGFTVIVTGWHQLYGEKRYSFERIWPRTTVDVAGFDVYNTYGERQDGETLTAWTDVEHDYFSVIAAWARSEEVAWGLAETGYTDAAHEKDPDWVTGAYRDLVAAGGVAFTYFNSRHNSAGSWFLASEGKQADFARALSDSARLEGGRG